MSSEHKHSSTQCWPVDLQTLEPQETTHTHVVGGGAGRMQDISGVCALKSFRCLCWSLWKTRPSLNHWCGLPSCFAGLSKCGYSVLAWKISANKIRETCIFCLNLLSVVLQPAAFFMKCGDCVTASLGSKKLLNLSWTQQMETISWTNLNCSSCYEWLSKLMEQYM